MWSRYFKKKKKQNYGKIFARDHSRQCPVQYLENIGPAMEQSDWLILVIGPLNYFSRVIIRVMTF